MKLPSNHVKPQKSTRSVAARAWKSAHYTNILKSKWQSEKQSFSQSISRIAVASPLTSYKELSIVSLLG